MDPMTALGGLSGGGGSPQIGGASGPAVSGSNGQFHSDLSNKGDFIVGGSKNDTLTTVLMIGGALVALWILFGKKK